jgi:hypothetical protein
MARLPVAFIGVIRLRDCFSKRSSLSAQDDSLACLNLWPEQIFHRFAPPDDLH